MDVTCEKCNTRLKVPETALGKSVRCPKCQNKFVVEVPEVTVSLADSPEPAQPHAQDIAPQPPSPLDELASATESSPPAYQQPHAPMAPAAGSYPRAGVNPQLGGPGQLVCLACGYQGFMAKKRPTWVTPVALIGIFFTGGLSLFLFLIPKTFVCPACGTARG
jgi:DNA-directed RNA polymerase subunit RPC12/RpoP